MLQGQLQNFLLSSKWQFPTLNHIINLVPGPQDTQNSYCSELAGISGNLLILQATCNKYKITSGSITMALDNQSAIDFVTLLYLLNPKQADHDLL